MNTSRLGTRAAGRGSVPSRRDCLARLAIGALCGGCFSPAFAAATVVESRAVTGFDQVSWGIFGELLIQQTSREHLSIEAEPAVLAKIVTEVRDRRLRIEFAPGRVETRQPIRIRLEVKSLSVLETGGSGEVRIGPLSGSDLSLLLDGSVELSLARLNARKLTVHLGGSGDARIDGGAVEAQRVVIDGSARYDALALDCREADVAIEGSGTLRVAVSDRLSARIAGSGEIEYAGSPRTAQSVTGAGEIRQIRAGQR
jgi:hypothetical protein